ncbi:MAG TPA: hypothetical protein VHK69_09780 [Chitinophagaceae bacterium]|nr:hypothetical protein [Chitinophagaceae bacterium]
MPVRNLRLFLFLFLCAFVAMAFRMNQQTDLSGTWLRKGEGPSQVLLLADGYAVLTEYDLEGKRFLRSRGGTLSVEGEQVGLGIEFNTADPATVGTLQRFTFQAQAGTLTGPDGSIWERKEKAQSPLAGTWRITERMQEGQLVPIHQTGTRKTLKLLTDGRFQWVAIDPGKKEFSGTGGGRYTFKNGTYTEHIEFFSRDSTRVGASLSFSDKVENGKWHHTGLSSRGEKIYEVWSRITAR